MAKMKFDFKQFLMQKGERVGLAAALGLMGLLFLWGILGALGAKSPAKDLAKAAENLNSLVNRTSGGNGVAEPAPIKIEEWQRGLDPDQRKVFAFFEPGAAGNPRRTNPMVLPVDHKVIDGFPVMTGQLDVVFLGTRAFDLANKQVYYMRPKGGGANIVGGKPGFGGGEGLTTGAGMKNVQTTDKKYKEILVPIHAVVVSATYPVKEQLELIRKALRYNDLKEMFSSKDANQRFVRLVVSRREITRDGKVTDWVDLKLDDDKEGPTMDLYAALKGFEPEDPEQLKHIFPGLVMPRPYALTGEYPLVKLDDIPPGEKRSHAQKKQMADGGQGILGSGMRSPGPGGVGGPGGGTGAGGRFGPGMGAGQIQKPGGVGYEPRLQPFKELTKDYQGPEMPTQAKFEKNFDLFEINGFPYEAQDKQIVSGQPSDPRDPREGSKGKGFGVGLGTSDMMQGRGAGQPGATGRLDDMGPERMPDKGLIRFLDVTVKPGHTYQYSVKVLLANPNHNKKDLREIAYADLGKPKTLESAWVITAPVRVGPEIYFYNVDQLLVEGRKDFFQKKLRGTEMQDAGNQRVAIQVHRFLGKIKDIQENDWDIGDWAIAERLLVPRGEYIGRHVDVEMPAWNAQLDDFELINSKSRSKAAAGQTGTVTLDFSTRSHPDSRALVVDFQGGQVGPEESATELLIIGPDGKLAVRNSRDDIDPENPQAVERESRLELLRERIQELKRPRAAPIGIGGGGKGS
jgi:hypothetical protein